MDVVWEVLFYQTAGGDSPVEGFLDALSDKARAKCLAYMRQLEEHGFDLPHSVIAKVRGKIWELRPEWGGNRISVLLCGDSGPTDRHPPRNPEAIAEAEGKGH